MPGESGALTTLAGNGMKFAGRQDARDPGQSPKWKVRVECDRPAACQVGNRTSTVHTAHVLGVGQLPAPAVVLLVVVDHQNEQPNYQQRKENNDDDRNNGIPASGRLAIGRFGSGFLRRSDTHQEAHRIPRRVYFIHSFAIGLIPSP